MIISKLQGGLGNQLFQYAVARALSTSNKYIYLDHQFLETYNNDLEHFTARKYELGVFHNLKAKKAHTNQVNIFLKKTAYYKFIRTLIRPFFTIIKQHEQEYINVTPKTMYYLDGYFQSEKYFKSIRQKLLRELEFPELDSVNNLIKDKIKNAQNPVNIHVRRGDYLRSEQVNEIHNVISLNYYDKVIACLKSKYQDLSFFIFSDDLTWVKTNLLINDLNVHYIDNNEGADSWKDMALMSECKHHIIANSSFSWWGAWLSDQSGDIFAPYNWFGAGVKFDIKNIIPDNWSIIYYD